MKIYISTILKCCIYLGLFWGGLSAQAAEPKQVDFFDIVSDDYSEFYRADRLFRAGVVFTGAAVFAHSDLDQNIQDDYQMNTRTDATDDFSKIAKVFGEGKYLITLSLATTLSSYYLETDETRSSFSKWGINTFRAYIVGGPATLLTQQLTGASRPRENNNSSNWKPFGDSNGVSGHAFIGAVPFMTIARMNNDTVFIKYLFYTFSTFTALSRVNDNSHYFSQIVLGWYLAYEATDTVFSTNRVANKIVFRPFIRDEALGLALQMTW